MSEVILIADAVVADTNTDYTVPLAYGHAELFLQVDISGTFNVQVLGKLHADAAYVEVVAVVADAGYIQPIAFIPYLRITTSGGAATPIMSAWIMIGATP